MTPTIRLASTADAADIHAIYAPIVQNTAISFEVVPPIVDELADRIRSTTERWPWLVCKQDECLLGYAYAGEHRTRAAYQWAVDVSVYVAPDAQRGGVGRALYTALLSALPLQGFYTAYAGIALPNAASVGLHEALGFQPVGVYRQVGYKLSAWHDVGWWQRSLRLRIGEPDPPRLLPDVYDSADWRAALASGMQLLTR